LQRNLLLGARPGKTHPHSHGPIDSMFAPLVRINLLMGLMMDGSQKLYVNIFLYTFIVYMIF
jgi:hypothetical protein